MAVSAVADRRSQRVSARAASDAFFAASWNAQQATKRVRRSPGDTVARRSRSRVVCASSTFGTRYAAAARGRSSRAPASSASTSSTVNSATHGRPVASETYTARSSACASSSPSEISTSSTFNACSTPNSRRKNLAYRANGPAATAVHQRRSRPGTFVSGAGLAKSAASSVGEDVLDDASTGGASTSSTVAATGAL